MTLTVAKKFSYTVTATVLSFAMVACNADSPTASPSFGGAQATFLDPASRSTDVDAVERETPLANDVVVSAVIDAKGGSIKVKGTGFELVVPKGAVSSKTMFQVTALAGSIVAYEFEPHGATFKVPLTFSQETKDLVGETAGATPLLAYFSSTSQLRTSSSSASVTEVSPAMEITDATGKKIEGNIFHFSGYLVSSGRSVPPPPPMAR